MSKDLKFAVIGNPISHSLSPIIHQRFSEACHLKLSYDKKLVSLDTFEEEVFAFFKHEGYGLNITAPFKFKAYEIATIRHEHSLQSLTANTLWFEDDKLHAENTDGRGFIEEIKQYISLKDKNILILGTGGAAQSIIPSIQQEQPTSLYQAGRTTMSQLTESYDVIINATSASLFQNDLMLPSTLFENKPFCYDLNYQPIMTPFLQKAKEFGCAGINGLGMLIRQAAYSFYIWHKLMPSVQPVIRWFEDYFKQKNR